MSRRKAEFIIFNAFKYVRTRVSIYPNIRKHFAKTIYYAPVNARVHHIRFVPRNDWQTAIYCRNRIVQIVLSNGFKQRARRWRYAYITVFKRIRYTRSRSRSDFYFYFFDFFNFYDFRKLFLINSFLSRVSVTVIKRVSNNISQRNDLSTTSRRRVHERGIRTNSPTVCNRGRIWIKQ